MTQISRRALLAASTAVTLAACGSSPAVKFTGKQRGPKGVFAHGIASGDPTPTAAIIWTRISPPAGSQAADRVEWEVSENSDFETLVASGSAMTGEASDWTVKVDTGDLSAAHIYYYRFKYAAQTSPTGRFKTLATGALSQARLAVVSCAHWEAGFFNAYDHIARDDSFDAILHLGDYYYEYGSGDWGGDAGESLGRRHEPSHELLSLKDYRTRHAQYRSDANLQDMTAMHAMICMWDDHEVANDSWTGGAENHNEGDGDWGARKAASVKAYYEWMPVRNPSAPQLSEELYRSYSFGDLLTLVTMETRLTARAAPLIIDDYTKDMNGPQDAEHFRREILGAPDRHMIDDAQTQFIVDAFTKSKAAGQPWRLLGNQVPMGKLHTPDLTPHVVEESIVALEKDWPGVRDFVKSSIYGLPVYADSWDGYPWAREQFYASLSAAGLTDTFVLTGDAHEYWVNDLTTNGGAKMGVEISTTSITSPTVRTYFKGATEDYSLLMTQSNPDVRYYNAMHNGYLDITVTHKEVRADCITVDTILSRDYSARAMASFTVKKDGESLKTTQPKGLNIKQRALFAGFG